MSNYYFPHLELDKWAYEIEQELKDCNENKKIHLQKKLNIVRETADKMYFITCKVYSKVPRHCSERKKGVTK